MIKCPTGEFTEPSVFLFSARLSESSNKTMSTLRVVLGGVIAMTVTYILGTIVHNL